MTAVNCYKHIDHIEAFVDLGDHVEAFVDLGDLVIQLPPLPRTELDAGPKPLPLPRLLGGC